MLQCLFPYFFSAAFAALSVSPVLIKAVAVSRSINISHCDLRVVLAS